jgi:type IX secretion system PorP/SprF family membrane protein
MKEKRIIAGISRPEALASALFALAIAFVLPASLLSQQLPQVSQFASQKYMMNPAVAGERMEMEARAMNRYQWTGITDAPRTFIFSLQSPLRNPSIGVGGYLFTDNAGPTRRTGIQLSYAYHLRLNEYTKLSLGLSGGMLQFAIDGSKIDLANQDDPALYGELSSQLVFDACFGAYLYGDDYYIGASAPQILRNQIDLYNSSDPSLSRLENHYYFFGGYKWKVNDLFMLEPAFLVKYVSPAPVKTDINLRCHYRDMLWAGASWRSNDAWVAMVGYNWNQRLMAGYSFDFSTSNIRNHSDGTHEIQLGFRFGTETRKPDPAGK